jgi:nitrogen regulatory protein P-II 1
MLRELTAIIRSGKWKATSEALREAGFLAMTRQRVYGRGRQKGLRYGTEPNSGGIPVLPKWMLSLFVEDAQVDAAVQAICAANRTGVIGDGKIFISSVAGVTRLSDLQSGAAALDQTLPSIQSGVLS